MPPVLNPMKLLWFCIAIMSGLCSVQYERLSEVQVLGMSSRGNRFL